MIKAASTTRSASASGAPHEVKNHNRPPSSARARHVIVSAGSGAPSQQPSALGFDTCSPCRPTRTSRTWCTTVCPTLERQTLARTVSIMSIDPNNVTAPYLQLAAILRNRIASGEFAAGGRLPSLVDLEQQYRLNPKTIRKALEVLKGEDLIIASPGRGMFVKPHLDDRA
jgi:GntR family transcriptional regulator